jgi:phage I-like protein
VIEAARALQAQQAQVAALQSEVQGLRKRVAEDWWAGQIAAKRAIPADRKDALIALHMQDAAQADQIAALYPALGPTTATAAPPTDGDGTPALNAEQLKIAELLGQDPAEFAKALAADRKEQK